MTADWGLDAFRGLTGISVRGNSQGTWDGNRNTLVLASSPVIPGSGFSEVYWGLSSQFFTLELTTLTAFFLPRALG